MKLIYPLIIGLLLLSLGPTLAQESYRQNRVNLQVQVANFDQAADDIREAVSQFDAHIQNLNLHRENTSGNASIRVSPEQMTALVKELSAIGEVESQNQSFNDNKRSFEQQKERLDIFLAMKKSAESDILQSIPQEHRQAARHEFSQWVNNQARSAESSLKSYQEQSRYSEVHININIPEASQKALTPKDPASCDDAQAKAPCKTPAPRSAPIEFLVLCLINMAGLWLIYRRLDKTPGFSD